MPSQTAERLGNLLLEFGVLDSAELSRAENLSSYSGLPFGKCLVLLELITENDLKAILECQSLLRDNIFDRSVLAGVIQKVSREHIDVLDALAASGVRARITRRTRLGELLLDAQALSLKQLEVALKAADFSALPLGAILTSFEALEPDLIELALDIQRQIRRGDLAREDGIRQIYQKNRQRQIEGRQAGGHVALGEILREAKLLQAPELQAALVAAQRKGQLLGEYLVENQLITDETLTAALSVQNLVSAHLLSIEQACHLLTSVAKFKTKAVPDSQGLTFQDFLKTTGYLTNSKLRAVMTKLSSDPSLTLDGFKQSMQDTSVLRSLLSECFEDDISLINAGAVLFQLAQLGKITLNQALLTFAFRQNGVSMT
jgi:hypothetical protein